MTYESVLQDVFGFSTFRDKQREIIEAIVERRQDVCCIMPTGHGKSICYQLPPLLMGKPAIIVSPLLSLMEDQRLGLESKSVRTCCYNSTVNKTKMASDILSGKFTHIYITPETVCTSEYLLKTLESKHGLSLIAIDEAHCVSLWGQTFRSSYLKLNVFKVWFPDVPLLALTGTATGLVESSIEQLLKLKHPLRIRTSANRKNLSYFVHPKSDPLEDLLPHTTNCCIIYCQTRKDTESISDLLESAGVKCKAYHAGLTDTVKTQIHHDFVDDKITCIVATICFGMGIDKPDIKQVIHYGCPKDIESYCQETGRAGRNGEPGQCHIYFSPSDFEINRYFLKDIVDDRVRQYKEEVTRHMEKYLYLTTCRRRYILEYFGETPTDVQDICCDACSTLQINLTLPPPTTLNLGPEIHMLLDLISSISSKFGKVMYIKILRGESTKTMSNEARSSKYFGRGKSHPTDWWKMCVQHCLNMDLLSSQSIKSRFGSTIGLGTQGRVWLTNNATNPTVLVDPKTMVGQTKPKKPYRRKLVTTK